MATAERRTSSQHQRRGISEIYSFSRGRTSKHKRFSLLHIRQSNIKKKYNLSNDEILYVGDDINDIPCLESVKYAVTVQEANYKVKMLPHIQITQANAGNGAFREIVDNIIELKQQT